MNDELSAALTIIENLKSNLTDSAYKDLVDSLMRIHMRECSTNTYAVNVLMTGISGSVIICSNANDDTPSVKISMFNKKFIIRPGEIEFFNEYYSNGGLIEYSLFIDKVLEGYLNPAKTHIDAIIKIDSCGCTDNQDFIFERCKIRQMNVYILGIEKL